MQNNKNKTINFLLVLCICFLSIFCNIIPVHAMDGGYSIEKNTQYVYITCGICKDANGSAVIHKLKLQDYLNNWSQMESDYTFAQTPTCPLCGQKHCRLALAESGIRSAAFDISKGAHSDFANYQDFFSSGNDAVKFENILKFDSASQGPILETIRTAFYGPFTQIGLLIIAIYFILDIGEQAQNDSITYESLLFLVVKTFLALIVLNNAFDWVVMGIDFCAGIFTSVSTTITPAGSAYIYQPGQCVYDTLMKGSFFSAIGEIISSGIFCLFVFITHVVIQVLCWARVFDIFIRITFAPIGVADFIHGGTNCMAVRYFKKLLASVMQGACIMVVLKAYDIIVAVISSSANKWDGMLSGIILGFAVITASKQTGKIANDALGV